MTRRALRGAPAATASARDGDGVAREDEGGGPSAGARGAGHVHRRALAELVQRLDRKMAEERCARRSASRVVRAQLDHPNASPSWKNPGTVPSGLRVRLAAQARGGAAPPSPHRHHEGRGGCGGVRAPEADAQAQRRTVAATLVLSSALREEQLVVARSERDARRRTASAARGGGGRSAEPRAATWRARREVMGIRPGGAQETTTTTTTRRGT